MLFLVVQAGAQMAPPRLRFSMLTCGVGKEIYASFGHTGIRVIDSSRGTDEVYNYGTFNGFEENFELKFMRGNLMYYLAKDDYYDFLQVYVRDNRKVEEQELIMPEAQKQQIYEFLENNLLPQNRAYKYDYFYDNCATRVRDVFPKTYGDAFVFGKTLPDHSDLSYRRIMDRYLASLHWERFGIDLLLGSKIDKIMDDTDVMFLPDYLREGVAGARLNGKPIAGPAKVILPGMAALPSAPNQVLFVMLAVGVLTVLGVTLPKLRPLGNLMQFLVLFLTGFLGCLIVVMWFATDHVACRDNWNILWALPTNIVAAFLSDKKKERYAIVALLIMPFGLILHFTRVQEMPMFELWPLLVSLIVVYGTIYKRLNQRLPA